MKTVYLMQGIPGSGKSTVARAIQYSTTTPPTYVCSADRFWYTNVGDDITKYDYDPSRIGEAHAWCQAGVERLMREGLVDVIVDNTNIRAQNVQVYKDLAAVHGYQVVVIRVDPGLEVCKARNALRPEDRKVPESVIDRMHSEMEDLTAT